MLFKTLILSFLLIPLLFASPVIAMDELLQKTVKNGLINYTIVKKEKKKLKTYINHLVKHLTEENNTKKAMVDWINLYNTLTLDLIIQYYPEITSITELKRPWDRPMVSIKGKKLSLNDIEHKKLRATYKDYRLHFVLVCASIGCPDLRNSTYTYKNIENELKQETIKYINSPKGVHWDGRELKLSLLFKWYRDDFKPSVSEVLQQHYKKKQQIKDLKSKPNFIHYDWNLNLLTTP